MLAAAAVAAPPAPAAQPIGRNARHVRLAVDRKGEALVTFRQGTRVRRVLAWGGLNAVAPTTSRAQVGFEVDYAGGWGKYHRRIWKRFRNVCGPYRGPRLAWFVTACTAPDGSHWALQAFPRLLRDYGLPTTGLRAAHELHLSHWTGELPALEIHLTWQWRRVDELFGRFTYRGAPVYGFAFDRRGAPLDSFGRLVFIDTYDSGYGSGWARHNAILFHRGTGTFCETMIPGRPGVSPLGTRYRVTANGPGVTPIVSWRGPAPGPFDLRLHREANAQLASYGDPNCPPT